MTGWTNSTSAPPLSLFYLCSPGSFHNVWSPNWQKRYISWYERSTRTLECLPCCGCSWNISNISQQWECCPFTIAVNHFHLVSWTQYNGYLGKLLKMMTKWWQNDYKMMTKWWQEVLMSVGWWDKLWLSLTFSFSNSTGARLSSNLGRASPKSNRWQPQV